MQNKKSIINNHNMKYLNNTGKIKENCICRNKTSFKWKRSSAKHYLISKNYFKPAQIRKFILEPAKQISNTDLTITRNHSTTNNMEMKRLSKEYWTIKHSHFTIKVTWRITKKCAPFNKTKRKC